MSQDLTNAPTPTLAAVPAGEPAAPARMGTFAALREIGRAHV